MSVTATSEISTEQSGQALAISSVKPCCTVERTGKVGRPTKWILPVVVLAAA